MRTQIGGRRVTLKDIAEELNVSHATVSRALNSARDSMISEAVRKRVREVASDMGYRPNHAGRALVTGRTGLLSLWLWAEATQTAYHSMVSRTMYEQANDRAYQLIVDLVGTKAVQPLPLKSFDPWNVDGIIAHESGPAIQAVLAGRSSPPIPVVSTGSYHFITGVDRVALDIEGAAIAAMEHLIESGRKRILYVTETGDGRPLSDQRYQAYVSRMEAVGQPLEILQVPPNRMETRSTVRSYVQEKGCPDAFYCHHDDVAVATYRALCDLKMKVPDDAAIVGCNGTEETAYLEVPLTTIALPVEAMLQTACDFLERRMKEPDLPLQEARLSASLLIRPSSGGPDTWPTSHDDPLHSHIGL